LASRDRIVFKLIIDTFSAEHTSLHPLVDHSATASQRLTASRNPAA
jgi:hypothetical protein